MTCNFRRKLFLRFDIIYVLALQQIPWNNFLFKPPANVSHGKTFSKHFPLSSLTKAKFFHRFLQENEAIVLNVFRSWFLNNCFANFEYISVHVHPVHWANLMQNVELAAIHYQGSFVSEIVLFRTFESSLHYRYDDISRRPLDIYNGFFWFQPVNALRPPFFLTADAALVSCFPM